LCVELQSIEDIGLLRMAGTVFCRAISIVANLAGWFCQVWGSFRDDDGDDVERHVVTAWSAQRAGQEFSLVRIRA
jgi:hypothetical protein